MANENEGLQTQETTEPTKYLDKKGLETFWGKVKALVTAAGATIGDVTDDLKKLIEAHIGNKNNPHGVTKAQVELGNVTNDAQVKRSEMGKANGVATLDSNGRVPLAQLGNLDTSLYIIPSDNKLPTTGIKTNKIYLIKETSGTNNVYTEYIYVNSAWEKLGQFKADVDLTPYAKLDGGNQFTGQQVVYDDETDYRVQIDNLGVTVGDGDNDLTISNSGIKVTNGSATKAFATDGTTIETKDFALSKNVVSNTTYNTDKRSMENALKNKLDKSGGTINGDLAVTGTLTKGGKAVLTDHQAIYSLTVQKNGTSVGTFNPKSANATINVTVPTKLSQLSDDNVLSGKYLPLKDGGKIVDSKDSAFYTKIEGGDIVVGINDVGNDTTNILINRSGITLQDDTTNIGSATQAFATNGGKINMNNYATTDAMNTELKKYLPLTGGTLTGQVSSPSFIAGSSSAPSVIANSSGLTATTVNAAKIVNTNHAQAKYLLCGDGTVAERIDETEIAAICV